MLLGKILTSMYSLFLGKQRQSKNCFILKSHIRTPLYGRCNINNLKNDRMISVYFQGKPFNTTVIQVYAPTSNAEEAEVERFYEDLQDFLELTPPKAVLSL